MTAKELGVAMVSIVFSNLFAHVKIMHAPFFLFTLGKTTFEQGFFSINSFLYATLNVSLKSVIIILILAGERDCFFQLTD